MSIYDGRPSPRQKAYEEMMSLKSWRDLMRLACSSIGGVTLVQLVLAFVLHVPNYRTPALLILGVWIVMVACTVLIWRRLVAARKRYEDLR